MSKKENQSMPQSSAGILRFSEDTRDAAIKIKPEYVVAMCVAVGGTLLVLRYVG